MDNIIEPNETFDFSKLSLAHPNGIQGGAYFTKILYNAKPLYIQTIKSQTRQGFVKTGKKYYCDLMFDKNAETLINWFENLEERCQKLIYEKRDNWFQNTLEEGDIESAFNSAIRIYKSGKYYLVRANVKNTHTNIPAIKIYDEKETPLTIEDIKSENYIYSILEIQGIKFTSRNFQIEIEIKQVMVLDNEPIFDNCLIKTNKVKDTQDLINNNTEPCKEMIDIKDPSPLEEIKIDDLNNDLDLDKSIDNIDTEFDQIISNNDNTEEINNTSVDLNFEDLNEIIEENSDDLKEIDNNDLNLENNLEILQLKKPNQVYFEIYKEARNKAKLAKKNALLAYLEAKNIKKTYMLDNLNDYDSDIDAEIDEVSESELEGL
jgi:hypothetical protein